MPKINKQFELEIKPEQFLLACSLLELQEVELLLDSHIRRAEHRELRKAYTAGGNIEKSAGYISECGEEKDPQQIYPYSPDLKFYHKK